MQIPFFRDLSLYKTIVWIKFSGKEKYVSRVIEKYNCNFYLWEEIEFHNLITGDVFRIFDNGERYINKEDGNNVWITTGEPYLNTENIWTIDTLY